MNILSQAAVLILIVVVGIGFLMIAGGDWRPPFVKRRSQDTPYARQNADDTVIDGVYEDQDSSDWSRGTREPEGTTLLPPILYIDQLDPSTMRRIKRFELNSIPTTGATISRPNAGSGTIKLDGSVREAYSVSEKHARIGMDEQGLFIQDQKDTHRMRLGKTKEIIDEVDITNGLVIYLGLQPLRFVIPDFWSSSSFEESDTNVYNGFADRQQIQTFGRRNRNR